MNSWPSKITFSLALLTACGALNSCRLGAGKYSSQTEVETEVPDSLEHGRPSSQPAAASTASYPTANGVPTNSNLIETSDTIPMPGDLSSLPSTASSPALPGGAALSSNPADPIDLPKPDFSSVSVHNPRQPPATLTLENPLKNTPRMSAGTAGLSKPYTSSVARETLQPAQPVTSGASKTPSAAGIANAPKATRPDGEPGIPLLHSGARLSDFYAVMHQPLLDQAVVDNSNNAQPANEPAPPPATDDTAIPAPPPGSGDFAAPKP